MMYYQRTKVMRVHRRILYSALTIVLTLALILVCGEVLIRLCVPSGFFLPVSNIYQTSTTPGLVYTYKSDFQGIAFGVELQTNSLGFRGPNWSKRRIDGTFRIVLIGDSHAFGYGVPYECSVGEVLAETLEKQQGTSVEVLNFGVNGYNSSQQHAILEHVALPHDPDLIILMPSSNDHERAFKADHDGWLHWDGIESNMKSRIMDKSNVDKIEAPTRWVSHSRLLLYLFLIKNRQRRHAEMQLPQARTSEDTADSHWMAPVDPGTIPKRLVETVFRDMESMLHKISAQNIPVIIAPFAAQRDYRQMFRTIERDHNVPVIELLALFPEAHSWESLTTQFGLGWDNHLNAVAHRRYAEGIAKAIEAHGYLATAQPIPSK